MILVSNSSDLTRIDHEPTRQLLSLRFRQLESPETPGDASIAFLVVGAGESLSDIQATAEVPIASSLFDDETLYGDPEYSPAFEVLEDHGGCFEIVFILSDSGAATVVLVPKIKGIDPKVLAFCAEYAVPAP